MCRSPRSAAARMPSSGIGLCQSQLETGRANRARTSRHHAAAGRRHMMKMEASRRTFLHLVAGAAALPTASRGWAQTYPSRPITIVIPFPPGGSTDVIGRILSERMRPSLGQSVVVENVGGANGSIGAGRVARAAPDGYTLTIGNWNNFVANGALYSLQFDLRNDFKPIALLSETPLLLAAKKNMPAQNLTEFIAWLKENPNKASEGHSGIGSVGHV